MLSLFEKQFHQLCGIESRSNAQGVRGRLFAVSIKRKIGHPALAMICTAARHCSSESFAFAVLPRCGSQLGALHLRFWRVGNSSRRQAVRQVDACDANPVVGHAVINVEAVR